MKKKLSIEPNAKNISDLCKTFQEKFNKSVSEAAPSSDCDLKKLPFRSSSFGLPWRPLRTKTDKGPSSTIKGDKESLPFVIRSKMKKKKTREAAKKFIFLESALVSFRFVPSLRNTFAPPYKVPLRVASHKDRPYDSDLGKKAYSSRGPSAFIFTRYFKKGSTSNLRKKEEPFLKAFSLRESKIKKRGSQFPFASLGVKREKWLPSGSKEGSSNGAFVGLRSLFISFSFSKGKKTKPKNAEPFVEASPLPVGDLAKQLRGLKKRFSFDPKLKKERFLKPLVFLASLKKRKGPLAKKFSPFDFKLKEENFFCSKGPSFQGSSFLRPLFYKVKRARSERRRGPATNEPAFFLSIAKKKETALPLRAQKSKIFEVLQQGSNLEHDIKKPYRRTPPFFSYWLLPFVGLLTLIPDSKLPTLPTDLKLDTLLFNIKNKVLRSNRRESKKENLVSKLSSSSLPGSYLAAPTRADPYVFGVASFLPVFPKKIAPFVFSDDATSLCRSVKKPSGDYLLAVRRKQPLFYFLPSAFGKLPTGVRRKKQSSPLYPKEKGFALQNFERAKLKNKGLKILNVKTAKKGVAMLKAQINTKRPFSVNKLEFPTLSYTKAYLLLENIMKKQINGLFLSNRKAVARRGPLCTKGATCFFLKKKSSSLNSMSKEEPFLNPILFFHLCLKRRAFQPFLPEGRRVRSSLSKKALLFRSFKKSSSFDFKLKEELFLKATKVGSSFSLFFKKRSSFDFKLKDERFLKGSRPLKKRRAFFEPLFVALKKSSPFNLKSKEELFLKPQLKKKHTRAFVGSKESESNLRFSKSPYLFWRRLQKLNASIKNPKKPISFLISETELLKAVSQRKPRINRTPSAKEKGPEGKKRFSFNLKSKEKRFLKQSKSSKNALLLKKKHFSSSSNPLLLRGVLPSKQGSLGSQPLFYIKKAKHRIYLQSLLNQLALFRDLISDSTPLFSLSFKKRSSFDFKLKEKRFLKGSRPVFESLLTRSGEGSSPNSIQNPPSKENSLRRGAASFGPFVLHNKKLPSNSRQALYKGGFSGAKKKLLTFFLKKQERAFNRGEHPLDEFGKKEDHITGHHQLIQGVQSLKNSLDQIFVSSSFKNTKIKLQKNCLALKNLRFLPLFYKVKNLREQAKGPEGKKRSSFNLKSKEERFLKLKVGTKQNMKDNKKIIEDSYTAWLQNEFDFLDNAVRLASFGSPPPIEGLKEHDYAHKGKGGTLFKNRCPSFFHSNKKTTSRVIKMQHPILISGYTFAAPKKLSFFTRYFLRTALVSEPKLREENFFKTPLTTRAAPTKVLKSRAFQPLLSLLSFKKRSSFDFKLKEKRFLKGSNSKQGALVKKEGFFLLAVRRKQTTRACDFQTSKSKASLISNLFAHSFLNLNSSLHPSTVKEGPEGKKRSSFNLKSKEERFFPSGPLETKKFSPFDFKLKEKNFFGSLGATRVVKRREFFSKTPWLLKKAALFFKAAESKRRQWESKRTLNFIHSNREAIKMASIKKVRGALFAARHPNQEWTPFKSIKERETHHLRHKIIRIRKGEIKIRIDKLFRCFLFPAPFGQHILPTNATRVIKSSKYDLWPRSFSQQLTKSATEKEPNYGLFWGSKVKKKAKEGFFFPEGVAFGKRSSPFYPKGKGFASYGPEGNRAKPSQDPSFINHFLPLPLFCCSLQVRRKQNPSPSPSGKKSCFAFLHTNFECKTFKIFKGQKLLQKSKIFFKGSHVKNLKKRAFFGALASLGKPPLFSKRNQGVAPFGPLFYKVKKQRKKLRSSPLTKALVFIEKNQKGWVKKGDEGILPLFSYGLRLPEGEEVGFKKRSSFDFKLKEERFLKLSFLAELKMKQKGSWPHKTPRTESFTFLIRKSESKEDPTHNKKEENLLFRNRFDFSKTDVVCPKEVVRRKKPSSFLWDKKQRVLRSKQSNSGGSKNALLFRSFKKRSFFDFKLKEERFLKERQSLLLPQLEKSHYSITKNAIKNSKKKRRALKQKRETGRLLKRKRFHPRPAWLRVTMHKKLLKYRHIKIKNNDLACFAARRKQSLFATQATTAEKEFYSISQSVFAAFQQGLWKSSWLRSNLNSYLRKIKTSFNLIKQTSQKSELGFSTKKIISDCLGLTKAPNAESEPRFAGAFKKDSSLKWNTVLQIAEYNQITYHRIQQIITNMKHSLGREGAKRTSADSLPKVSLNKGLFVGAPVLLSVGSKEERSFVASKAPPKVASQDPLLPLIIYKGQNQKPLKNFSSAFINNIVTKPGPFDPKKHRPFNNAHHKLKRQATEGSASKPSKKAEPFLEPSTFSFNLFNFANTVIQTPGSLKSRIHQKLKEQPFFTIQTFGNMSQKRVYWALNKTHMWHFKNSNKKEYLWANQKQREQNRSNKTKKIINKILTLPLQEQYPGFKKGSTFNLKSKEEHFLKGSLRAFVLQSKKEKKGEAATVFNKNNKNQKGAEVMGLLSEGSNQKSLAYVEKWKEQNQKSLNTFFKKQEQKEIKMGDLGFLDSNGPHSNLLFMKDLFANSFKESYNPNGIPFFDEATGAASFGEQGSLLFTRKAEEQSKKHPSEATRAFFEGERVPVFIKEHKMFLRNLKNTLRVSSPLEKATNSTPLKIIKLRSLRALVFPEKKMKRGRAKGALLSSLIWSSPKSYSQMGADARPWGGVEVGAKSISYVRHNFLTVPILRDFSFLPFACQRPLLAVATKVPSSLRVNKQGPLVKRHTLIKKSANTRFMRLAIGGNYSTLVNFKIPRPFLCQAPSFYFVKQRQKSSIFEPFFFPFGGSTQSVGKKGQPREAKQKPLLSESEASTFVKPASLVEAFNKPFFLHQQKGQHRGQFFITQAAFLLCTIIFHLCSLFSLVSLSQIRCVIKFLLLLSIKLSSFVKIFRLTKPFKHKTLLMAPKIRLRKVPKSSPFLSRSHSVAAPFFLRTRRVEKSKIFAFVLQSKKRELQNLLHLLPKASSTVRGLAKILKKSSAEEHFLKQQQPLPLRVKRAATLAGGSKNARLFQLEIKRRAFFRQGAKKMPLAFFLTTQLNFWPFVLQSKKLPTGVRRKKLPTGVRRKKLPTGVRRKKQSSPSDSCFFDKKNEKGATKLNTFLKVSSKKLGFVLHTGLSKVTDIRNTSTKSASVFLGKPGESLSVWINHLFLIEIAADSTTTIPENFDSSLWNSYAKLAKSSSTTPILGTLLEKRLLSSLEFFLERVSQPDTDLIVRQRKGTIFLDNLLFRTSPALKSVSKSAGNQRPSLRGVLPSFLALLKKVALPKESSPLLFSRRAASLTDHMIGKSTIFDWVCVARREKPPYGRFLRTPAPPLKELQNIGNSKVFLLDMKVRKRWSANQFITFKGKDSDLLIHAPPAPKSFHSLYPSPFLLSLFSYGLRTPPKGEEEGFKKRSSFDFKLKEERFSFLAELKMKQKGSPSTSQKNANHKTWGLASQDPLLPSQKFDGQNQWPPTRIFLAKAPTGKPLQHHYNFNAEGIAPLGTIVCQIYSGLFSKETAKSCLVVGLASKNSNYDEKSLLIQSLAGETEMKIIRDNANRYNFALGIKSLRNVFDALALHTPCIFLIEDIHVIGERRPLLVGDDENARAESSGESHDEKNLSVAKLTRHSIMHYRKPFRGDFSSLIPANNFSFDLFLENDLINQAPTLVATKTTFLKPKNSVDELPWIGGLVLFQKSTLKKCSTFNLKSKEKHFLKPLVASPTKAPSSLLSVGSEPKEASNGLAYHAALQKSKIFAFVLQSKKRKQPFLPSLYEQKGRRGRSNPPTIFSKEPEVQKGLLKIKNSIRVKIALLANLAVSNLSVKLNMITDLLVIIDGVRSNRGFVVFATTHIPSSLDPALRRPGRLDETIVLPFLPKLESRWEIVKANFARSSLREQEAGALVKRHHLSCSASFSATRQQERSEAIASSDSFFYKSGGCFATPSLSLLWLSEGSSLVAPFKDKSEHYEVYPISRAESSSPNLPNLIAIAYSKIGKLLINNRFANCAETNLSLFSTLHSQLENQQNQIHVLEPYLHLYTTQSIVKQYLMGLFAPKVAETFAFSGLIKKRSLQKITGPLLLATQDRSKGASSLIFTLIEKRLIYKKNVIIPRLLQFYNAALLSLQEPSCEASFLLLPAKRYENYKQTFLAMQKLKPASPSQKSSIFEGLPRQNFDGAELKGSNKESGPSDSDLGLAVESQSISPPQRGAFGSKLLLVTRGEEFFDKPTAFNRLFRSQMLNRHRGYLNNQWWNGQLYEHNVETTFLSDIDWRSNCFASKKGPEGKKRSSFDFKLKEERFLKPLKGEAFQAEETTPTTPAKMWENFYVDFPDFDQHYNPGNRRWVLHFGYWSYWSNFKTEHSSKIYSFMAAESFLETFNYLNSRREIVDYFVTKLIKTGSLKDINVIDGTKRF